MWGTYVYLAEVTISYLIYSVSNATGLCSVTGKLLKGARWDKSAPNKNNDAAPASKDGLLQLFWS